MSVVIKMSRYQRHGWVVVSALPVLSGNSTSTKHVILPGAPAEWKDDMLGGGEIVGNRRLFGLLYGSALRMSNVSMRYIVLVSVNNPG
ncbi:MAG: hypothetical protein R3A46_15595 [Thermomicrobiales bacterium]